MTETVGQTATLVHGWTMADLHRLARHEARRTLIGDFESRYDAAWHAAVVHLYESIDPPTWRDMHLAARAGVDREYVDNLRHHGVNKNTKEPAPRFATYWRQTGAGDDDFTERLAERMALPQVLAMLDGEQYEALVALAAHGNQEAAAAALGISRSKLTRRLSAARKIITELWFAPEHPRVLAPLNNPDTCRLGHPRATYGYRTNSGRWSCKLCALRSNRRARARLA